MVRDIPHREDQRYSLEDAREQGVPLSRLRMGGSSAWQWQIHLIPHDKIQWDKMQK